jgi:trigger factor
MAQSDIKITFEDLKTFTTKNIRQQMAQFGQTNPTDAEVQGIVARVLSNQDEVKDSDQVVAEKLLELFKEKQILQRKRLLTMNLLLPLTENKFES